MNGGRQHLRGDARAGHIAATTTGQHVVGFTNHPCPAILELVEVDFLGADAPFVYNNRMWYVYIPREQVSEGLFI